MSFVFVFTQKTAYEMRISDCSSDVCSSDIAAWCNVAMLYAILHRKGHFRLTGQVAGRIARIIVAAAAMAAALHYAIPLAGDAFIGGVFERIVALGEIGRAHV